MKAPCGRKCKKDEYCVTLVKGSCKYWQEFVHEMQKGREHEDNKHECKGH